MDIRDSRAGGPNVGRACYDTISILGNSVTVVIARSVEGNASVIELIGGGIGGKQAVLSRITEVLFVEVLRSWIKSLGPGDGAWLGAIADPHIGKALRLIHERPGQPWTLRELGRSAGLGRAAFAARFTRLVGQPVHRYLVARRMDEAALMLESSDAAITRIETRVGYETTTAFSKMFRLYHGLSPGRYRARKGTS